MNKIFCLFLGLSLTVFAEEPYAFRSRLVTVHRADRRDMAERPAADEYAVPNGVQIVVPENAPELVQSAENDFADYLIVSMRVNASVRRATETAKPGLVAGVTVSLGSLEKRGFVTTTAENGVRIVASDDRMAAQAFYRLEDRMNFRRGPFL